MRKILINVGIGLGVGIFIMALFVGMFFAACGQYMGEPKLITEGKLDDVMLGALIHNSIIEVTIDGKKYDVWAGAYVDNYGNPKIGSYVYLYQRGIDGFGHSSWITYKPIVLSD